MYLTHKDLSKYWIVDIETDPIPATRIHLVVAANAATGELQSFRDREALQRFVQACLADGSWFVGHNFLSFDAPTLNRLWDAQLPLDRVIDTLVLSYLYYPRMPGGHSLEAWGERFKFPKIKFNDWSSYSAEMHEYCEQDVRLTLRLFTALTKRMRERGFSERSCRLEHEIRRVVDKQERNGFYFDIGGAMALRDRILGEQEALAGPIHKLFPPVLASAGVYNYRTKRDGTPYATFEKHLVNYPKLVLDEENGTYEVFDWQDFNIASPKQRLEKLLSLGYKPTKKTKNGNPSIDEDALLEYAISSKQEEMRAIAEWLVLNGRASMLGTWLDNVNYEDSRMHGRVFTCGAGTRRMTHSSPNTANIPKAKEKVKYGKECRGLWTVEDRVRRRLVGYDAKGLEMRCFGHYLDDPVAAELYINGDPHAVNTANLGLPPEDRDLVVKNGFYAFLYGATNSRLDLTFNRGRGFGKHAREILLRTTPGLQRLVDQVQAEQAKGGWIECIDGGWVRCDSPHAALNYKLQSAGGIVMKQASIFIDERCEEQGIDHMKVGDIHDEGQHDTAVADADRFGQLAVQAIRDAGEELNFKVPLDGDYKIGFSWADTH